MTPNELVLDKSYLRAAAGSRIVELCDEYRVLLIEDLALELLTGDLETRTKSFAKFPKRINPVAILPNVGTLLGYEREHRRPASPIWEHRLRGSLTINEGLASGDFELTPGQSEGVAEWESRLAVDVTGHVQRGETADEIFPELRNTKPGQAAAKRVVESLTSDFEYARSLYDRLRPEDFPPASIVGRRWAAFRWFQVHLIAACEFFSRFGSGVNPTNPKRLENERTDLNYLIMASLAKGLATSDGPMAQRFSEICPSGILIT